MMCTCPVIAHFHKLGRTLPPLQLPPARTSSFLGDSAPQQDGWKPSSLPLLPLQTALAGMYVVVMPDLLLAAMALAVGGDLFLHAARGPRLIGVHLRAPVGHGLWVHVGSKLFVCFTHFDEVTGDNLPTFKAKEAHVLGGAENV